MAFLHPSSIAIIGASSTEGKLGHAVLANLISQGYEGKLFPINPKGGEIQGLHAYTSVSEVDGNIDLAIVVIPAATVCDIARECAEKNVQTLVVISAGFSEVHTEEGKQLEETLRSICTDAGINLIGPNCLGMLRPSAKMNASFAKDLPPAGNVALVSQSGAFAVAIMDASVHLGLGYSSVISIGNKAAMSEVDFLTALEADDETKVIGLYLESISDGRAFVDATARIGKKKPIVLLKSGVSEHGKKAAASHTGALAGSDTAVDAACLAAGIYRAHSLEEMTSLLKVLSAQPRLPSANIAIITNAGGPGILATDETERVGLSLPRFEDRTLKILKDALPAAAGMVNPIDVVGDADTTRYAAALTAVGNDANIDGIVCLLTPQVMTPCTEIAQAIVSFQKNFPLIPVTASFMGGESVHDAIAVLENADIPTFETPEAAVRAMASLQSARDDSLHPTWETSGLRSAKAADYLDGKGLLDPDATAKLFALYDLPLPVQDVAETAEQAVEIAERIGYPVIAKISAPNVLHKTDIGGVRANLKTAEEVEDAFGDILLKAKSYQLKANHILIQQFLPAGDEFIVGALRDPSFGPMVMVGLGGIYTELFADTAFRLAPVTSASAYTMLTELNAWKLLLGLRGKPQADIDELARIVEQISILMTECPQISELDLNPVLVRSESVTIADAKVIL